MIKLRAYAKLNLSLDVTGKRNDGYHELDTLMQSVSLFDVVTIKISERLSVNMDRDLSEEKSNTAYRAAMAFSAHTKIPGADICIKKQIPAMSGLGGASADAAAVLTGLDTLYETRLGKQTLCKLAESIGADVPFALTGGTARAMGIGEKLTPIDIIKPMYYTVVKPATGVSTAEAFRLFRPGKRINIKSVQRAVLNGNAAEFNYYAENALQPAASKICPEIIKAIDGLINAGAAKALITGSGSAVFSAFETKEEAMRAKAKVDPGFELCGVFLPVPYGVEVI